MKPIKCLGGLIFLALAAGAWSQKALTQSKLMKEFAKLQEDYNAALDKYYVPYDKVKTDAERAKVKLNPKLDPSHKFMPIFVNLAKRAVRDPGGASCEYMVLQTARNNRREIQASYDRIVTFHKNHPLSRSDFYALSEECRILGNGTDDVLYLTTLKLIKNRSKLTENKALALIALGDYTGKSYTNPQKDTKRAVDIYRQIIAKYPMTKGAKRALSSIFEMENLQIGMVAPDFELTDQNGKSWKLSEYRGQVVVLDFWGFW